MRHHPDLMTHLQWAEDHARKAWHSWDATDLARCAECLEHLQQAAGEIQSAQQSIGEGALPAEPAAQARDRLQRLHSSVSRLGRLVDAAIAFHRGLALQSGMEEAVSSKGNG